MRAIYCELVRHAGISEVYSHSSYSAKPQPVALEFGKCGNPLKFDIGKCGLAVEYRTGQVEIFAERGRSELRTAGESSAAERCTPGDSYLVEGDGASEYSLLAAQLTNFNRVVLIFSPQPVEDLCEQVRLYLGTAKIQVIARFKALKGISERVGI